ncbi:MAG: hypothetical protein J6T70_14205, partial [Bacteroidales bacterium]|nr:hypothetical protein [Bacteroidales bacterium]
MENTITALYRKHPAHSVLKNAFSGNNNVQIKGLNTSASAFFVASDDTLSSQPLIFVADSEEDAAYIYNDFQTAEQNRPVY